MAKARRRSLTDDQRERILAFLREREDTTLADMIVHGTFFPDVEKWDRAINELERRRSAREAQHLVVTEQSAPHEPIPDMATEQMPLPLPDWLQAIRDDTREWISNRATVRTHAKDIRQFTLAKWKDATSPLRQYAMAWDQPYVVQIDSVKFRALGFETLIFQQSLTAVPTVSVDVQSSNCSWPFRLSGDGELIVLRPFPFTVPPECLLLVNLGVVLHFFDLVVPVRAPSIRSAAAVRSEARTDRRHLGRTERRIPRRQRPKSRDARVDSRSGATTPHYVDPFRRKLPQGQSPTFQKIIEADQFGINLQGPGYPEVQYTFVREHVRGLEDGGIDPGTLGRMQYRAVKTLDTVLSVFGF